MVIIRMECEVDILLNIVLYHAKINDVYDDSAYGFRYSMGVGKNVCKACDHYDDEKAEFQYGLRPQFPRDDINSFHLYRVLYALEVWSFDLDILTISDAF